MTDRLSDGYIDNNEPFSPNQGISPSDSNKLGSRIVGGCTEWIPYLNQSSVSGDLNRHYATSNMTSLSEGLFWDLSNIALAQGRLQRKILLNNKQEVWRDMYVILEKDRIWMFSQNVAARASLGIAPEKEHLPPTYVPLPCENKSQSRLMAQIVDSNVFSIVISYGITPNNGSTPSSVSTAVTLNELTTTLVFRTKSMDIAEYWVKTVYRINERIRLQNQKIGINRSNGDLNTLASGGTVPSSSSGKHQLKLSQKKIEEDLFTDNDVIANIENSISVSQSIISDEEIKIAGRLSTFEGMMQCSYLRGYFQKYLMTESLEETLLFWEYAEDFRRGHPQTQSPFAFALAENCRIDSADGVRQWAESIYLSFVEAYAFLQVSQCDTNDMDRIGDLIKGVASSGNGSCGGEKESTETDEERQLRIKDIMLPPDLFDPIQRSAFRTMKYNFYPEFVKQPNYFKLLRASVHAWQRAQKRLNLFSSFLHSDVEHPSSRGIIHQPPSEVNPIPSKTEAASIRFPVFNFMTRGRNANGTSDKNNKSGTGAIKTAPVAVMVTPWRKRMSSARSEKQSAEQRLANSKTWGVNRMMATSAIAKRNKVTWMPEWWWDYIELSCPPLEEEAAIRSVWVAEEMRMSAEAALKAKKHKSEARKQKRLEAEAKEKELQQQQQESESKKTEEDTESDSDAESVVINTNGNPALYALALEGFDSDHSFDGGKPGAGGPMGGKRRSVMEESSGEDLYRCPSWMPQNIDDVRQEIEQKLEAYNLLMSQKSDVANDIHRELLLRLQNRDGGVADGVTNRLSDGGSSHPYSNSGGSNGVYRSHPVHAAAALETSPGTSDRAELKRQFLTTSFLPYQPHSYLGNPGIPGVGTVLLSASVRCRYYKRKKPRAPPPVTSNSMMVNGSSNTNSFSPQSGMSFSVRNPSMKINTGGINASANSALPMEASVNNANLAALKEALDSNPAAAGASESSGSSPSHASQSYSAVGRRQRSPSDEFLGQGIAGVEWVKQYALISIFLGEARICLYDPLTMLQSCSIVLSSVLKIAPTVNQLHSIDVIDAYGLNWQLIPEGVDEDDNRNISKRWLELLSIITLPTTEITYIVKSGYLNKRGRYNKAFKQRWFVLTSDYKLRYYKDDSPSSQYKGEIVFEPSTSAYDVIRFNKEITMHMKKIDRTFILMAEDAKVSEEWVQLIYQLLLVRDTTPQHPSMSNVSSGKLTTGTIPEVDDEDDEDD